MSAAVESVIFLAVAFHSDHCTAQRRKKMLRGHEQILFLETCPKTQQFGAVCSAQDARSGLVLVLASFGR